MTPVLLAVEEGHLEIVRFFLHNDEIGTEHLEDEELFGGLLHKAMRRRTDVLLMSCPPQWKTRKTEETDTRTSPAQSEKKVINTAPTSVSKRREFRIGQAKTVIISH